MSRAPRTMPGFGLTLGSTLFYLGLIVFLPVAGLGLELGEIGLSGLWAQISTPRAIAAFQLSLGTALIAALVNIVFGLAAAWALTRYRFPGRDLLDAVVDLPFALPTAVSGIALTSLFAPSGWLGSWLQPLGIQVAFSRLGIVIALIFIGIPFAIRTLQPALTELDAAQEEISATLGATRFQTLNRIVLPHLLPSLLTAFGLCFARAIGEYGSVIFIAGNLPMKTEVVPLLIIVELEQYNMAGATALGFALLCLSLAVIATVQALQRHSLARATGGER